MNGPVYCSPNMWNSSLFIDIILSFYTLTGSKETPLAPGTAKLKLVMTAGYELL